MEEVAVDYYRIIRSFTNFHFSAILLGMNPYIQKTLKRILHTNEGQLRRVPNRTLILAFFVSINVLLQGIADVVLKLVSYSSILPPLPWRTDFLFLTAVSVLMGYRSFQGMLHQKFDVTKNSIELGVLVEVGLVVGDIIFIRQHLVDIPHVLPMRLPFVALTTLNIFILLYNYQTLNLRKWWKKRV